jgi:hypothetical protein
MKPRPAQIPEEKEDPLLALPEVKDIVNRSSRVAILLLLQEVHKLREQARELDEKKKRLTELLREEGMEGVRNGRLCVSLRYQNGKKSFSREAAIDAGITPDQIDAAMVQGKSYTVVTLDEIETVED